MENPVAVVVGLCAHGLAITRSLSRAGIRVVAIEANESLPGTRTRTAEVVIVDDINGAGLVSNLIALAPSVTTTTPPVLFLTNDSMIETLGTTQEHLDHLYRISWWPSRVKLLPLLRKGNISRHCTDVGLLHPKSRLVSSRMEVSAQNFDLRFPLIFKPDKPVSGYKTLVVENDVQLGKNWSTIESSLPAIVQEFILGDDSVIYFAALYLDRGKIIARFEGRKLRSRPMGHTTVAISEANDVTHDLARKFFANLDVSGPVSLELKKDPNDDFWVIEPTVGRTDFWVGLCIGDGVDLPLIEYCQESGLNMEVGRQHERILWINGERDPAAIAWLGAKYSDLLVRRRIVGVYVHAGDYRPFIKWAASFLRSLPSRFAGKFLKIVRNLLGVSKKMNHA